MLVLLAHSKQGLATHLRDAEVTGGKSTAPTALKVTDDDGRLPGVAWLARLGHRLYDRPSKCALIVHRVVSFLDTDALKCLNRH